MTEQNTIIETKHNGPLEIIEYNGCKDIRVRFLETGYETTTTSYNLKTGCVKDPLRRSVCGVGYLGIGDHKPTDSQGKKTKAYSRWKAMLEVLFHDQKQTPSEYKYKGRWDWQDDWLNFQRFAVWYEANEDEILGTTTMRKKQ